MTTHGIAVNVANDLQPFEWIVPCGIEGCAFTSVTRERGAEVAVEEYAAAFVAAYAAEFGRAPVAAEVSDLDREAAPANVGGER